jgi:hypothetical protein
MTDADANSAILVMHAHRDHRAFEPGVADPGHGEQQLSGQEARYFHLPKMPPGSSGGKP